MIIKMYITMMPVILAGIINMIFVKTSFAKRHSMPMDGGRLFGDNRRLFGENKTWIGFAGMIAAGAVAQVLWGLVCSLGSGLLAGMNYFYDYHENTLIFNVCAGALCGFAYVLFELPNSFIKRRLDIPCGKTDRGLKGKLFFVIDQIDSLIGVALVFAVIYPMPIWQYFLYILLGALTHIGVNFILYKTKIRKNF